MRTCPKCGAKVKSDKASRCQKCGYLLPREQKATGVQETGNQPASNKSARNAGNKSRTDAKMQRQAKMSHKTDRIRITPDTERTFKDESYDGYYDDVLPTDTGEYRQGLDQKTVRNIARAFSELSVERQKLLTLVFLYDLKPEEAAEVLHYSIKKFYNNKYEALKKLRTMLSDQEDSHER